MAVGDAAAGIAVETLRCRVVEAQTALQMLALLCSRHEECGMTAYLEVDGAVVGVLHMPDDMYLVALELIGDGKVEMVGIDLQCLLAIGQRKGDTVGTFADKGEIGVAGKAVPAKMIGVALAAVGVLPQAADQWEEYWGMTVPIFLVPVPKIFLTFIVLNGLQFRSMLRHGQHELVIFDLFHR